MSLGAGVCTSLLVNHCVILWIRVGGAQSVDGHVRVSCVAAALKAIGCTIG